MSVSERQVCPGVDCRTVSVTTRTVPKNSGLDVPDNCPPVGSTAQRNNCLCNAAIRRMNGPICPFQPTLGVYKPPPDVGNIREPPTKDCSCCCNKPHSLYSCTTQGNDRRGQKPMCSYCVENDDAVWNVRITKDFGIATASSDLGTTTQTTETRMITAEQLEDLLPLCHRYVVEEDNMRRTSDMGELGFQCPEVDCLQLLTNLRQTRQISESQSERIFSHQMNQRRLKIIPRGKSSGVLLQKENRTPKTIPNFETNQGEPHSWAEAPEIITCGNEIQQDVLPSKRRPSWMRQTSNGRKSRCRTVRYFGEQGDCQIASVKIAPKRKRSAKPSSERHARKRKYPLDISKDAAYPPDTSEKKESANPVECPKVKTSEEKSKKTQRKRCTIL